MAAQSPQARPSPPVPVQPQTAMATSPAPQGGGMLANIATTAAGVAIGSAAGHAITGFYKLNLLIK